LDKQDVTSDGETEETAGQKSECTVIRSGTEVGNNL
jgi:hypothetical protein